MGSVYSTYYMGSVAQAGLIRIDYIIDLIPYTLYKPEY